jgi:hypothetical protein
MTTREKDFSTMTAEDLFEKYPNDIELQSKDFHPLVFIPRITFEDKKKRYRAHLEWIKNVIETSTPAEMKWRVDCMLRDESVVSYMKMVSRDLLELFTLMIKEMNNDQIMRVYGKLAGIIERELVNNDRIEIIVNGK